MKNLKRQVAGIIYSRMLSKRFPNKAVYNLCGTSLLERVINRSKLIKNANKIIVATSNLPEDDVICEIASKNNVEFYRGSHLNVYQRTIDILKKYKLEYFFRICGDRPLLDPYLYDLALEQALNENLDLCTTLSPRIIPAGLTVEVLSSKSFLSTDSLKLNNYDREHITNRYYSSKKLFNIKNIILPRGFNWQDIKEVSYTLDTREDISFLEFNINNLSNLYLGIEYQMKLQELLKQWKKINK